MMEPILYHFYCIMGIQGPDTTYSIETDHIIPKALFETSTIKDRECVVHNLYNLALLPKNLNGSKGKKRLIEVTNSWLKSQIAKYTYIEENEYATYSDINNYRALYKKRYDKFQEAFSTQRTTLLNN